jgi:biopolymer transport protein ExbD
MNRATADSPCPWWRRRSQLGSATSIVISVAGPDLVFTEDGKYTFAEIRQWLANKGREHPGATLLLRTDAGLALGDFTEIVSAADSAGLVVSLGR